jgi:hypothetical protein
MLPTNGLGGLWVLMKEPMGKMSRRGDEAGKVF